jgi:hypothetical protein
MDSPEVIRELAHERLEEAEILYQHSKYEGSFYLAGYSVELSLKARIAEKLGIPDLFKESLKNRFPEEVRGSVGQVQKSMRTHDLNFLLILGGFWHRFQEDKLKNKLLFQSSNVFFQYWNEGERYSRIGSREKAIVEKTVNLLQHEDGLIQWIENN